MKVSKKRLLKISEKIRNNRKITPEEIEDLTAFEKKDDDSKAISLLKKSAVPLALIVGCAIAVFPNEALRFATALPSWTNLPNPIQNGANYMWNILSEPVENNNVVFHLPNIILYSFGFLGVKKLFDALDRKTWIDRVNEAKQKVNGQIENGNLNLNLSKGHSILFTGNGDFIAIQFINDNKISNAVTISSQKPKNTNIWNYYNPVSSFEDLQNVIERVSDKDTGEYIFFPVKDDQIFLPGPTSYDLSPHKLDILCQDLRSIEKKRKWKARRILIVGDRFHTSYVQSEDKRGKIKKSEDLISLHTISNKYPNIGIIDPTDIVLKKIIEISSGRTIAFRATREGILEYKKRFYNRLELLKHKPNIKKKGILTIGYDVLEDQTEQQTLSRKIDDYYPVVLSKAVRDALIRNGYKKDEFIYVPELVLTHLKKEASKQ